MQQKLNYLEWTVCLVLIVFACIFDVNRCTHFDNAFYLSEMLNSQKFAIMHGRYLEYAIQWLPLIGIKFGLSLTSIIFLFSINQALFFIAAYAIIKYFFGNRKVSIIFLLSLVLMIRYKYFSVISEIQLSLAALGLWYGYLTSSKLPSFWLINLAYSLVLIALMYGGHPFAYLAAALLWLLALIEQPNRKRLCIPLAVMMVSLVFKYLMVQGSGYESGKLAQLLSKDENYDIANIYWEYAMQQYPLVFILLFVASIVLLYRKKYFFTFFGLGMFVFLQLIILKLHSYLHHKEFFMLDGYLGILGFFAAVIIVQAFYLLLNKNVLMAVLILLFGYSFYKIQKLNSYYDFRHGYHLAILNQATDAYGGDKFLLERQGNYDYELDWYVWSVGFETLLLSELHPEMQQGNLVYLKWRVINKNQDILNKENLIMWKPWTKYHHQSSLNKQYFHISTQPYRRLQRKVDAPTWHAAWQAAGKPHWRDFKTVNQSVFKTKELQGDDQD